MDHYIVDERIRFILFKNKKDQERITKLTREFTERHEHSEYARWIWS
jgi:hypothetical protein